MPPRCLRNRLTLAGAAGALCLSAACDGAPAAVAPDVWAVVDGREIRQEDVEKAYRRVVEPQAAAAPADEVLAVKLSLVDELITRSVLLARAAALDLQVTEAEVDAAFADRRQNLTEEAFQQQLRDRQLSDVDLRQALRDELLVDKLMERDVTSKIEVTEQQINDFYGMNRERFNVPEAQYRIAQIVVTPVPERDLRNRLNDDATSPGAAQRKAEMLMERLKTGADFGQLAMDYSEDAQTAPAGGDLGFLSASMLEQVPPQLRNVVVNSEPGQVSVVSAGGAHTLVLLISKEPAGQRDLNTPGVRESIRQLLHDRREQLLRAAYITTARNEAVIVNHLARQIVQAPGAAPGLAPASPGGQ